MTARGNYGDPIHHQLASRKLGCGAEHREAGPPWHPCCKRDLLEVTCEPCRSAAGQLAPRDEPAAVTVPDLPQYSFGPGRQVIKIPPILRRHRREEVRQPGHAAWHRSRSDDA